MMTTSKTDNSHIKEKIELRLKCVNEIEKHEINILEAFAGSGILWNSVQKKTEKKINILKIEKKNGKKGVYLHGDNMKFLPLFELENYDIIDLDAYGIPTHQFEVIFEKKFTGYVIATVIFSMYGQINNLIYDKIGLKKTMYEKCRTLFSRNGFEKVIGYLANNGVKEIKGYFIKNKNYFYYKLN